MAETRPFRLGAACALPFFFVLLCRVEAASFRPLQPLRKDPDYGPMTLQRFPNPDMIKALEYIEDLRKQANDGESGPDYGSYRRIPYLPRRTESQDQGHLPESGRDPRIEDEAQWVEVVREALRRAEEEWRGGAKGIGSHTPSSDADFVAGASDDYKAYEQPERRRTPLRHHEDGLRDSPFKRTNEIVDEQYTPQSLATLESAFRELGEMAGASDSEKARPAEERKLYADDEDDVYRANDVAYEDVVGGEDWNPTEERAESETQEEIRDGQEDIEEQEEETDEGTKRSGTLAFAEGERRRDAEDRTSEDVAQLASYYLRRLTGGTGWQKSRTGGEPEEKRAATFSDRRLDPQSIAQLIEISQSFQIPPEDLLDTLRGAETKRLQSARRQAEPVVDFPEDVEAIAELGRSDSSRSGARSRGGAMKPPLNVLPDSLPEDLDIDDIVNLLGAEELAHRPPSYLLDRLNLESDSPGPSYVPRRWRGRPFPRAAWVSERERRRTDPEKASERDGEVADDTAKASARRPDALDGIRARRGVAPAAGSDPQEDDWPERALGARLSRPGAREAARSTLLARGLSAAGEPNGAQSRQIPEEDLLAEALEFLRRETAEPERVAKRAPESM